jgi:hypothetical protein
MQRRQAPRPHFIAVFPPLSVTHHQTSKSVATRCRTTTKPTETATATA